MGIITRLDTPLGKDSFPFIFNSLVKPHLKYCFSIWYLLLKWDEEQIKTYFAIHPKQFQEKQTFRFVHISLQLTYQVWCIIEFRLTWSHNILNGDDGSLHELFKISTGFITRGHNLKLPKPFIGNAVRKHFLIIQVIKNWNSLPHDIINAVSINSFKAKMDKIWLNILVLTRYYKC